MEEKTPGSKSGNTYRFDDPSPLTTAQILREVGSLKELFLFRIEAMEQAIKVAHDDLVRFPTEVEKSVGNLQNLHEERFKSIERRFVVMDYLRDEKIAGIQKQIDMQEKLVTQQYNFLVESINKSDLGLVKVIDQQAMLIVNTTKSTDEKIDDLKRGMSKLDSLLIGQIGQSAGRKDFWGYLIGGAGLIGTVIAIVGYFIIHK